MSTPLVAVLRSKMQASLFLALALAGVNADAAGPLTVDASGRNFMTQGDQKPFYMAAVGGPEGFLYETDARKQKIVDDLVDYGGNGLYMHTIRAFGGDGASFEHPFNRNDPASGIKPGVFDNWMNYIEQLDSKGIVTWMHVIDDTSRPWGCSAPLPTHAKNYIRDLVNTFKSIDHLVWLSGEEFEVGGCTSAQDAGMMKAIAAEIRRYDTVHPIGVHHNNSQPMQFGNDPNINVFAQQICKNNGTRSPQGIHNAAQLGDWVYVMAECHPWHRDLMESGDRTTLRRSAWGTAMAGGHFMMYDAYECGRGLCSRGGASEPHDPTPAMLGDLRRLQQFMQLVSFSSLLPRDDLAAGGTQWVLANTAAKRFVAYSSGAGTPLSVRNLPAGNYALTWYDPVSGATVQDVRSASQAPFAKPASFGVEAALYLRPQGGTPPPPPPPPPPSGAFTVGLFNAATDSKIADLQNGDQLSLAEFNAAGISSLAIALGSVPAGTASVRLTLGGPVSASRIENVAPYSVFGDSSGNYAGKAFGAGSYTLRMQAYPAQDAGGSLLLDSTHAFKVVP